MSGARYPRELLESVLLEERIPDNSYRIIPHQYRATPLGTRPADSRFCFRSAGYTVLYASPDFTTAFIETVVRDRFVRRRERNIALKEVTGRLWMRVAARPGTALTLLDIRADGCTRIGAPTDAVHARSHAAGRALARMIHTEHGDVEGLLYGSRLTGEDVYAVFDRGVGKLDSVETGALADHPKLPEVLERRQLGLVS